MPKEVIESQFKEVLGRMNAIEPVSDKLELRFKIMFQEGVIRAQKYIISKLNDRH